MIITPFCQPYTLICSFNSWSKLKLLAACIIIIFAIIYVFSYKTNTKLKQTFVLFDALLTLHQDFPKKV